MIIIITMIIRDYIAGSQRDLAVEEEVGRRDRGKRRKLGEEGTHRIDQKQNKSKRWCGLS